LSMSKKVNAITGYKKSMCFGWTHAKRKMRTRAKRQVVWTRAVRTVRNARERECETTRNVAQQSANTAKGRKKREEKMTSRVYAEVIVSSPQALIDLFPIPVPDQHLDSLFSDLYPISTIWSEWSSPSSSTSSIPAMNSLPVDHFLLCFLLGGNCLGERGPLESLEARRGGKAKVWKIGWGFEVSK
jgi:hypothetical protein